MPPAMLPGAMPPMSAWCAMLHTNAITRPSTKTGIAMLTSGRCVPPATCGSLAMKMSPACMSSSLCLASSACIRPSIEARWIGSEPSAWATSSPLGVMMVAPLLDVGRVGALHQRDEGLVGDRAQAVVDDLQRDRVELRHGLGLLVEV